MAGLALAAVYLGGAEPEDMEATTTAFENCVDQDVEAARVTTIDTEMLREFVLQRTNELRQGHEDDGGGNDEGDPEAPPEDDGAAAEDPGGGD